MKILLMLAIVGMLCAPWALATGEPEEVTVKGKVYFSDYYSMGGEKCAAFLETEDDSLVCILDNMNANTLSNEMGNFPGKIKAKGMIKEDSSGKYLRIEEYSIMEKRGLPKGSGSEHKGSY